MLEKYVSVYMAPSAFLNESNFYMFLINNEKEIVNNRRRLKIAPETYSSIGTMVRHGEMSKMISHMVYNKRYFAPCSENLHYALKNCLSEDVKKGKVLVIIGENAHPDLYTSIVDSIDVAEIVSDGNLRFEHRYDASRSGIELKPYMIMSSDAESICFEVTTSSAETEDDTEEVLLEEQLDEILGEESTDEPPEVIMFDRKTIEEIRSSLIQLKNELEEIVSSLSDD